MHFPAISRAQRKRRDQTVSTPLLPCRTASKQTKRHLLRRFLKRRKTTRRLRNPTSKFYLQHGLENPSQRYEVRCHDRYCRSISSILIIRNSELLSTSSILDGLPEQQLSLIGEEISTDVAQIFTYFWVKYLMSK